MEKLPLRYIVMNKIKHVMEFKLFFFYMKLRINFFLFFILLTLPSFAVLAFLYWWPGSVFASFLFFSSKLVLVMAPLIYFYKTRGQVQFPFTKRGKDFLPEVILGILTGVVFFVVIAVSLNAVKSFIDIKAFEQKFVQVGLNSLDRYLLLSVYWCLINSFIEELFWRWMSITMLKKYIHSNHLSIVVACLFFCLHHVLAIAAYGVSWPLILVGTLGVFIGGMVWGYMFVKQNHLWGAWISHILADAAIFWMAWNLIPH